MTRPVVRGYSVPGGRWYLVTGRFPTEGTGRAAYEMIMRRTPVGELGIYRHGPPEEGGTHISAVSISRPDVLRVARLLAGRGAADVEMPLDLAESMFLRRARVVVEHAASGAPAGRTKIRHAGRGARLDPDGTMHEPGGGQG